MPWRAGWTPAGRSPVVSGVDSGIRGCPPRSASHVFEFTRFSGGAGGSGVRVASQKFGPVAGDMSRQARQHTQLAQKEPRTRPRGVAEADSGPQGKDQRLSFLSGPRQRKDGFARDRAARASPELISNLAPEPVFCPVENCPPHIFPSGAQGYAPPASSITFRFDRLRLNRRRLSFSEMTQSP